MSRLCSRMVWLWRSQYACTSRFRMSRGPGLLLYPPPNALDSWSSSPKTVLGTLGAKLGVVDEVAAKEPQSDKPSSLKVFTAGERQLSG
jgi:hypothetical protein